MRLDEGFGRRDRLWHGGRLDLVDLREHDLVRDGRLIQQLEDLFVDRLGAVS